MDFQRPEAIYESPQSSLPLAVWYAIYRTEVLEPYSFDNGTSTVDGYERMSRYNIFKFTNHASEIIFEWIGLFRTPQVQPENSRTTYQQTS